MNGPDWKLRRLDGVTEGELEGSPSAEGRGRGCIRELQAPLPRERALPFCARSR